MSTKTVLLIGGPADGQRMSVDQQLAHILIDVPPPAPSMAWMAPPSVRSLKGVVTYHVMTLRGIYGSYYVATPNGQQCPLKALIDNYPQHQPKE